MIECIHSPLNTIGEGVRSFDLQTSTRRRMAYNTIINGTNNFKVSVGLRLLFLQERRILNILLDIARRTVEQALKHITNILNIEKKVDDILECSVQFDRGSSSMYTWEWTFLSNSKRKQQSLPVGS